MWSDSSTGRRPGTLHRRAAAAGSERAGRRPSVTRPSRPGAGPIHTGCCLCRSVQHGRPRQSGKRFARAALADPARTLRQLCPG
ncbi:hypothetical protein G6F40_016931 [Rhizopus arrhizus]|nr:hypothetical protein G6F40_016931 [Rhizopus arrhizus]